MSAEDLAATCPVLYKISLTFVREVIVQLATVTTRYTDITEVSSCKRKLPNESPETHL